MNTFMVGFTDNTLAGLFLFIYFILVSIQSTLCLLLYFLFIFIIIFPLLVSSAFLLNEIVLLIFKTRPYNFEVHRKLNEYKSCSVYTSTQYLYRYINIYFKNSRAICLFPTSMHHKYSNINAISVGYKDLNSHIVII